MPQETASMESSKVVKPVNLNWQRGGLRWKISTTFSGLILVLGLLVIGIVYYFTANPCRIRFFCSARAPQLADAARVRSARAVELDAMVAK